MQFKSRLVGERSVAPITTVWLDVVMHIHVSVKVVLHCEPSPTQRAREGEDVEVFGVTMKLQSLFTGERDVTHVAWDTSILG